MRLSPWMLASILAIAMPHSAAAIDELVIPITDQRPRVFLTPGTLSTIQANTQSAQNNPFWQDVLSTADSYLSGGDPVTLESVIGPMSDGINRIESQDLDNALMTVAVAAKLGNDPDHVDVVKAWVSEFVTAVDGLSYSNGLWENGETAIQYMAKNASWKGLVCAYDWFRDDLDPNDAERLAEILVDFALFLRDRFLYDRDFYKYTWWADAVAAVYITMWGEEQPGRHLDGHISHDGTAITGAHVTSVINDFYEEKLDHNLARATSFMGTYSGYAIERVEEDVCTAAMFRSATYYDPFTQHADHYQNIGDWVTYWTTPAFHYGGTGDDGNAENAHARVDDAFETFYPCALASAVVGNKPKVLAFLRDAMGIDGSTAEVSISGYEWAIVLWNDPNVASSTDYSTLPLGRYFGESVFSPGDGGNSDYTMIRSGWQFEGTSGHQDDMLLTIMGGPNTGAHDKVSEGHFEIVMGDDLLLSDSGVYDNGRFAHYVRYHAISAALNTPAYFDPNLACSPQDPITDCCSTADPEPDYQVCLEGYQHPDGEAKEYTDAYSNSFYERAWTDRFAYDTGTKASYVHLDLTSVYDSDSVDGVERFFVADGEHVLLVDRADAASGATGLELRGRFHVPIGYTPVVSSDVNDFFWTDDPDHVGIDTTTQSAWSGTRWIEWSKSGSSSMMRAVPVAGIDQILRIGGPSAAGNPNKGLEMLHPDGVPVTCDDTTWSCMCGSDAKSRPWRGHYAEDPPSETSYEFWHREQERNHVVGAECDPASGYYGTGPMEGYAGDWRLEYDSEESNGTINAAWILSPRQATGMSGAFDYSSAESATRSTASIILNGATEIRFGWSTDAIKDVSDSFVMTKPGRLHVVDLEPGLYQLAGGMMLPTTRWVDDRGFASFNLSTAGTYSLTRISGNRVASPTFAIGKPTPNPTTGGASIELSLNEPSRVALDVFDVAGRRVWTGDSAELAPGSHVVSWDGQINRRRATPGVYWMRTLVNGEPTAVSKLVVR